MFNVYRRGYDEKVEVHLKSASSSLHSWLLLVSGVALLAIPDRSITVSYVHLQLLVLPYHHAQL